MNDVLSPAQQFAAQPDDAFVSAPMIAAVFDITTQTVHRKAREGRLPKPVSVGGIDRWRVGDLRAALGLSKAVAA